MSITKEKKKELTNQFQKHKTDTGSPELQVSILTERITNLTGHLATNKKDYQGQLGLLKMVGKRKSLLSYINSTNNELYKRLTDQLGIRS